MRKELLVAALGFLIGAAGLAGGQDDDDGALEERLDELQGEIDRARSEIPEGQDVTIRNGLEMRLYPVYDLTSGIPDFRPPAAGFESVGNEPAREEASRGEILQPFGTIEELLELLRSSVQPFVWEENAWMNTSGQTLLVGAPRPVQDDIAAFLDTRVRDAAHRCVTVEAQAVDMPRELYRTLASGGSTSLSPDQAGALDAAIAAGTAQRVFEVRATGFAAQNFVARHGRQLAMVAGADAVVSKGANDHDPRIATLRTGGYVGVRASVGDDAERITLDVDVAYSELEDLAASEVGSITIDDPKLLTCRARTSLTVPNRTWAIVGGGTPLARGVRILLVRATYLPRGKGGAK